MGGHFHCVAVAIIGSGGGCGGGGICGVVCGVVHFRLLERVVAAVEILHRSVVHGLAMEWILEKIIVWNEMSCILYIIIL